MAFKSRAGKTSGVCRNCEDLKNIFGDCICQSSNNNEDSDLDSDGDDD